MKLKVASLLVALVAGWTVNARSILCYYDFNQIANGSLVSSGINKGTGSLALQVKNISGSATPYTTPGDFGSGGAFYSSSQNSLRLASGTTLNLGGHAPTTVGARAPFKTATITDPIGNGALHVDLGEGVTLTNATVAFACSWATRRISRRRST